MTHQAYLFSPTNSLTWEIWTNSTEVPFVSTPFQAVHSFVLLPFEAVQFCSLRSDNQIFYSMIYTKYLQWFSSNVSLKVESQISTFLNVAVIIKAASLEQNSLALTCKTLQMTLSYYWYDSSRVASVQFWVYNSENRIKINLSRDEFFTTYLGRVFFILIRSKSYKNLKFSIWPAFSTIVSEVRHVYNTKKVGKNCNINKEDGWW